MKKLNITKEQFNRSKYFQKKYGKLAYVSESGKLFKTSKNRVLKFVNETSKKFRIGDRVEEIHFKDRGVVTGFTDKTKSGDGYVIEWDDGRTSPVDAYSLIYCDEQPVNEEKTPVFTVSANRVCPNGDLEEVTPIKFSREYETEDDAVDAANELVEYFQDDPDEIEIYVMGGEYKVDGGDIFGQPYVIEELKTGTDSIAKMSAGYDD